MPKYFLIGALVAAAYLSGRYSAPEKIKEIEKEKIVYRENVDEQKARDKTTRKKEVRLPDGTVTIETVIEAATSVSKKSSIDSRSEKETEKEITNRPGVILQGIVGVTPGNLTGGFDYGASATVPVPIFGIPIYAGGVIFIRQEFKFAVSAGLSF